jgi:hypothetical protein
MVSQTCNDELDSILDKTGIKSRSALIDLFLARYKDDFVAAYRQFSNQK